MKPYSQRSLTSEQRVFIYRLSRARRVVENAFGILANRFRVFMTPMNLSPEKVETITLACCAHNLLRNKAISQQVYMPGSVDSEDPNTHNIELGEWHNGPQPLALLPLAQQGSNRHLTAAKQFWDTLCQYFISEHGSLPWQWNMV